MGRHRDSLGRLIWTWKRVLEHESGAAVIGQAHEFTPPSQKIDVEVDESCDEEDPPFRPSRIRRSL